MKGATVCRRLSCGSGAGWEATEELAEVEETLGQSRSEREHGQNGGHGEQQ